MATANPLLGAAAGLMALVVAATAITGSCPPDWFAWATRRRDQPTAAGFDDARDIAAAMRPETHSS